MGALGYHTLTMIDGNVEAGVFHLGDYHLGKVRIGEGFSEKAFNDLMKRKPFTHVILDSTSSAVDDEYLVTYDEAVKNTAFFVSQHPEKQIFTGVISRSVQNLAIHLDVARQEGREVYIDGYKARIAFKAMQDCGYNEFDDIVFKGDARAYIAKFPLSKRYVIYSGVMAESKKGLKSGLYKLSEQEKVRLVEGADIKKKKNNKSGHEYFVAGSDTAMPINQRCIEEINGKQVRAMYARIASSGVVMLANVSDNSIGNYPTARLQRSGHAVKSETKRMVEMILEGQERIGNVTFIPTHGNPDQMINTAKVVKSAGGGFYFANNLDVLRISKSETKKAGELSSDLWIGVCEEVDNALGTRMYTYSLVDENFVVQEEIKSIKKPFIRKNNNFARKGRGNSE